MSRLDEIRERLDEARDFHTERFYGHAIEDVAYLLGLVGLADELAEVVTEFTGDDPKFDDPHPIDTALTRYHAARLSLLGEPA